MRKTDLFRELPGVGNRVLNALALANITSVNQLRDMTDRLLLMLPGFGIKCLTQLNAVLKTHHGFTVKSFEKIPPLKPSQMIQIIMSQHLDMITCECWICVVGRKNKLRPYTHWRMPVVRVCR